MVQGKAGQAPSLREGCGRLGWGVTKVIFVSG
jgi:hypothetical protein